MSLTLLGRLAAPRAFQTSRLQWRQAREQPCCGLKATEELWSLALVRDQALLDKGWGWGRRHNSGGLPPGLFQQASVPAMQSKYFLAAQARLQGWQ